MLFRSGHNLTLAALGVFILWFGWFGFNGGSTLGLEGLTTDATGQELWLGTLTSSIFINTNLSASCAMLTALFFTWFRYRKPDVSMTLNGALAGLVAITAGADCVDPIGAVMIGILAGFCVVISIEFIDHKLHIDDPVGSIGVHMGAGILGTVCVGLFSTGQNGIARGILYGGTFRSLGIQVLGSISVIVWVSCSMYLVFSLIKKTIGLRVSAAVEIDRKSVV